VAHRSRCTPSKARSVYVIAENAIGEVVNTSDTIQVTTSNPSVLSISGAPTGTTTVTAGSALPTITAGTTGTATLTLTDLSNPSAPKITETVTVQAATVPLQLATVNPSGQTNTAYTFSTSGVVGPFTIETTDAGGNMVATNAPLGLSLSQVEQAMGISGITGMRLSATGQDVSTVTIPAKQASVEAWLDGVTAGTTTSPTTPALSTLDPVLVSATGSGTTVTLQFDGAVEAVSNSVLTTPSNYFTVLNDGQADAVTNVSINGQTLTLTLQTAFTGSVLNSVSVAANTLQGAYGAPVAAISNQPISGSLVLTSVTATPVSTTVTAGQPLDYTLTVNPSFSGTVALSVTGASPSPGGVAPKLPTSATFSNGVAQVEVTLTDAVPTTLTFTVAGVSGQASAVTVNPAPVASFTVATPGTQTAGVQYATTVTAKDAYGNLTNNVGSATVGGTAVLLSPNGAYPKVTLGLFSNGQATLTVTSVDAQPNAVLTVSSGAVSGSSSQFTIQPAKPETMSVVFNQGASTAAWNSATDTLTALAAAQTGVFTFAVEDYYGNIETSLSDEVK
jgi:hypothetical protein